MRLVAGSGRALALVLLCGSAPVLAQDAAAARVAELEAKIAALQKQLDEIKAQLPKAIPSWKGGPEFADGTAGWSFRPRGRLHLDAGYVDAPDGIVTRNVGFNTRVRRIRIGAEGTMPGGFGYKAEFDFANSDVSIADAYLSYNGGNGTFQARLGNQQTLNGLDQMTSSNVISFTERAQFNDAFINTRRIGAVIGYYPKDTGVRLEAGLFAARSVDASLSDDGWIAAFRATYAPKHNGAQLHFGINLQHRNFSSNNAGMAMPTIFLPSQQQLARYRARPFTLLTDVRFVDTGQFAARSDTIIGVEAAATFGPLYVASELQWLKADAYRPGSLASGLDSFTNGNMAVTPVGDPGFFGGYAEIGYFLTGETRGYGGSVWQRIKVLNPLGKGSGAFQIAGRIEHLDLSSRALRDAPTNDFSTGTSVLAPLATRLGRGGTQTGYLAALNWYPIDNVRFMLNYVHTEIEGGPFAAIAAPLSADPINERNYATDSIFLRAQVDF